MKLSLKLKDEQQGHKNPFLVTGKLPISILNLPFLSSFTAGDSSDDLSFNLSTYFTSGPSLRLSYSPTTDKSVLTPFSISLKSGIGVFGSVRDSPLVISAQFNLFSTNGTSPNFTLQVKPQFGNFTVHKTTFSNPNLRLDGDSNLVRGSGQNGVFRNGLVSDGSIKPQLSDFSLSQLSNNNVNRDHGSNQNGVFRNGLVSDGSMSWTNIGLEGCGEKEGLTNPHLKDGFGFEKQSVMWKDLAMQSCHGKNGILNGFKVRANTALPLTSMFVANFRWGLSFPAEIGKKLPFLTIDKIGIEKVEVVTKTNKNGVESEKDDVEMLKGVCKWMRNDLEVLQKENWELKQSLAKLKLAPTARNHGVPNVKVENSLSASPGENSNNFEKWRSKKNGSEDNNAKRELKKSVDHASDVESELQKAIKAASAS